MLLRFTKDVPSSMKSTLIHVLERWLHPSVNTQGILSAPLLRSDIQFLTLLLSCNLLGYMSWYFLCDCFLIYILQVQGTQSIYLLNCGSRFALYSHLLFFEGFFFGFCFVLGFLKKIYFREQEWRRDTEGEALTCCPTHPCIHWLTSITMAYLDNTPTNWVSWPGPTCFWSHSPNVYFFPNSYSSL